MMGDTEREEIWEDYDPRDDEECDYDLDDEGWGDYNDWSDIDD